MKKFYKIKTYHFEPIDKEFVLKPVNSQTDKNIYSTKSL